MLSSPTLHLLLHVLAYSSPILSAPIHHKREVPQEHSHQQFLTSVQTSLQKNNPAKIVDSVFGLLGNAAASAGQGSITDTDCLHLATADQAFSNAKVAGDVQGMTDALIYAALERNTGKVGLASVACTSVKAVNPEIGAISQHQDPASPNAASINKAITLELAKQIASIGGDPQQALKSGTFAPGNLNDNTGKGNSCDVANDPVGCIFTQNLLVEDATPAEISAAVAGVASGGSAGSGSGSGAATTASTASAASTTTASTTAAAASASMSCTIVSDASSGSGSSNSSSSSGSGSTSGSSSGSTSTSNLDFGSCSNPAIKFGAGFDGRNENSFEPENATDFNHGSALNIKVIADFICGQLSSKCKASASTVTACQTAETAAIAKGKTGAAADAFNAGLGISSNFAALDSSASSSASGSSSNAVSGSAASNSTSSSTSTASAAASSSTTSTTSAATSSSGASSSAGSGSGSSSSSGNLQTFSGNLGGVAPPPVTTNGAKFCVKGNACFNSLSSALQRSCDVQHNKCADASNAAGQKKAFSVGDCGKQQTQCGAQKKGSQAAPAGSSMAAMTSTNSVAASSTSSSSASSPSSSSSSSSSPSSSSSSGNLQTFQGAIGAVSPPAVTTAADGQFCVQGNACFKDLKNAIQRSCDVQHNKCANASNAAGQKKTFSVQDCQTQQDTCNGQ